jgi:hypothetical protein
LNLRRTVMRLLALLPLTAAGCHKLAPDQSALQTVTLTGRAVANVPLAYARVQALDASLRPIPGVPEARTDAAGRYSLAVPAGDRPYVLRFSTGLAEAPLAVMAVTRVQPGDGTQVVNADAASHVAANVLLKRANGLDAALQALGAPELQGVVDAVRRSLSGRPAQLDSEEAVAELVSSEQREEAISPVLERLDRAAVAAANAKAEMTTSREIASTPATAAVPVAAVPSPSPSATAPPQGADAYKVEVAPEAAAVAPPPVLRQVTQPAARRRGGPEPDLFAFARARATVPQDMRPMPMVRSNPTDARRVSAEVAPAVTSDRAANRPEAGLPGKGAVAKASRPAEVVAGKFAKVQRSVARSALKVRTLRLPNRNVANASAVPQAAEPKRRSRVSKFFHGLLESLRLAFLPPTTPSSI